MKKVHIPIFLYIPIRAADNMKTCSENTCPLHEGGYCAAFTQLSRTGEPDEKMTEVSRHGSYSDIYTRHPDCIKAEIEARMLLANDSRRKTRR